MNIKIVRENNKVQKKTKPSKQITTTIKNTQKDKKTHYFFLAQEKRMVLLPQACLFHFTLSVGRCFFFLKSKQVKLERGICRLSPI
jgi:hypothetical protein